MPRAVQAREQHVRYVAVDQFSINGVRCQIDCHEWRKFLPLHSNQPISRPGEHIGPIHAIDVDRIEFQWRWNDIRIKIDDLQRM